LSFYVKRHMSSDGRLVVAVCDKEVLGKEFREGDIVLSVPESFYRGDLVELDDAVRAIEEADIAVVTGRRIVEELIRLGIVCREAVLKVGNQLHVQIVRG